MRSARRRAGSEAARPRLAPVSGPDPKAAPELVECRGAALGGSDATRRWGLRFPDGRTRFAGVTRPEGLAAAPVLAELAGVDAERALVQVALPVLLSEGAGPHLVDASGRLVLVLGPHPSVAEARVAMGEPSPDHAVGLVEPVEGGVWRWLARAAVEPSGRVAALDALDAVADRASAIAWERARRG